MDIILISEIIYPWAHFKIYYTEMYHTTQMEIQLALKIKFMI